jgi:hypothetical protein
MVNYRCCFDVCHAATMTPSFASFPAPLTIRPRAKQYYSVQSGHMILFAHGVSCVDCTYSYGLSFDDLHGLASC